MVVYRMADGVPTYVVQNDRNDEEKVLHQACLLLWIADQTDQDDGVSVNLAIAAPAVVGRQRRGK